MRLLVVNYEMDDGSPVLAWQAGVVRELARRAERVAVLTERAGDCALPGNVAMETVPRPGRAGAIGRRAAALGPAWRLGRPIDCGRCFASCGCRSSCGTPTAP